MRRTHDFFRVGAAAVITKAAAKSIGVFAERTGFGTDLTLTGFAGPFPMHAGGFIGHDRTPLVQKEHHSMLLQDHLSANAAQQQVLGPTFSTLGPVIEVVLKWLLIFEVSS